MNPLLKQRPRRLRTSETLRNLVAENELSLDHLVYPLFLTEGNRSSVAIKTMPGQNRLSADLLIEEIGHCLDLGIKSFALFPAISEKLKNPQATEALNPKGLLPATVRKIKEKHPEALIITDIALDPYSSDGHDGLVEDGKILNDETNEVLAKMALVHAEAGADIVAPSDMMDGRIGRIRQALEQHHFEHTAILSYCAKYASAFYGPFREALDSAPRAGDKKTYQMDYRNRTEASREARLDYNEGADILMVKPGLPYLDVVRDLAETSLLPIAVYNVSGEYAMIKAAAAQNMMDEKKAVAEILMSFRRAGAKIIFTYHAKDFATWSKKTKLI